MTATLILLHLLTIPRSLEDRVTTALERFEGFSAETYKDTQGCRTIGYGHKLSHDIISHAKVTKLQANAILREDIEKAVQGAYKVYPTFRDLPEPAQEALIHMAFQLGTTGLARFTNLKKAIERKQWSAAGAECLHSRWAIQTPIRAQFCAGLFGGIK